MAPRKYVPVASPAIEPAWTLLSLPAPAVPEKSTVPPELVMNWALPPSPLVTNCVAPPEVVVITALLAVELPVKLVRPPMVLMFALLALALLSKVRILSVLLMVGAFEELLTMPSPDRVKKLKLPVLMV